MDVHALRSPLKAAVLAAGLLWTTPTKAETADTFTLPSVGLSMHIGVGPMCFVVPKEKHNPAACEGLPIDTLGRAKIASTTILARLTEDTFYIVIAAEPGSGTKDDARKLIGETTKALVDAKAAKGVTLQNDGIVLERIAGEDVLHQHGAEPQGSFQYDTYAIARNGHVAAFSIASYTSDAAAYRSAVARDLRTIAFSPADKPTFRSDAERLGYYGGKAFFSVGLLVALVFGVWLVLRSPAIAVGTPVWVQRAGWQPELGRVAGNSGVNVTVQFVDGHTELVPRKAIRVAR